jgi:ribonuclease Z
VHDLHADHVETHCFELTEAFAQGYAEGVRSYDRTFLHGPGYTVEALLMDHGTPSVAYVVRETPRLNIDRRKLAQLGLRPGPWLQRLRGPRNADHEPVVVDGVPRSVRELQEAL